MPLHDEPRRASILHAIGGHDNGWREPDARPRLDEEGRIADFVHVDRRIRQGVWPRGVRRLEEDPWAAALVAHHAATVYGRLRGDPEWSEFFASMESSRDAHVGAARGRPDELAHDYTYLRLGDLISLTFCTGWEEKQSYGDWHVDLREGGRVVVDPCSLETTELPIAVEAVELPAGPFESRGALLAALAAAPRVELQGVVGPPTAAR